jgi:hypothetical protein
MHHGMARYASAVSSLLADIADVMLEVRGLAFSLTPERRCAERDATVSDWHSTSGV